MPDEDTETPLPPKDKVEELSNPPTNRTLKRRGFITAAAAATVFGGWLLNNSNTSSEESKVEEKKIIKGPVPGEYSNFIRQNRLIPTVFDSEDAPTRVQAAVDYLTRFRNALQADKQLRGEKLSDFGINSPDNYPIAIPPDWNIWDIVNQFLKDLSIKKVVTSETEFKGLLGTTNSYSWDGEGWQRQTNIFYGNGIKSLMSQIEGQLEYQQLTDAELAILLIHEYGHGLQDEMILQIVSKQAISGDQPLIEKLVREEIKQRIDQFQNTAREQGIINSSEQFIEINEAQANALEYILLYLLQKLNGSPTQKQSFRKFPGARLMDPDDIIVQGIRKGGDSNYINLYQHFVYTVIHNHNALNKDWLAKHVKQVR